MDVALIPWTQKSGKLTRHVYSMDNQLANELQGVSSSVLLNRSSSWGWQSGHVPKVTQAGEA